MRINKAIIAVGFFGFLLASTNLLNAQGQATDAPCRPGMIGMSVQSEKAMAFNRYMSSQPGIDEDHAKMHAAIQKYFGLPDTASEEQMHAAMDKVAEMPVSDSNPFMIDNVMPGSAAEKAGIQAGNRITKVNGVSLDGKTIGQIYGMLRGCENTHVTIHTAQKGKDGKWHEVNPNGADVTRMPAAMD